MITIQTTITLRDITGALASDWGPTLRNWAGAIAAVLTVPYVAGLLAGETWHRLMAWVSAHHLHGLARLGPPGGQTEPVNRSYKLVTHCLSPAPVHRPTTAVAPPRVSAIHLMAADGMSQRQIARHLGISRHRVKAELEA
jgi:hypothetical protein